MSAKLTWDDDMLAALRACIQRGDSWRAIGRRVGVARNSAQDKAFRLGWIDAPSRASRFGAAWHRAQP